MRYFAPSLFIFIAVSLGVVAGLFQARPAAPASAGQPVNHGDCTGDVVGIGGTADLVTYDAGSDIVVGVCVKSGANMFDGGHSPLITQDAAGIESCYTVTGIGSSAVAVERTGIPGSDCQAISHIDVVVGTSTPTPSPTPPTTLTPTPPAATSTPTPTPTPTALGVVEGPQAQGPQELPATGGNPAGADPSLASWFIAVGLLLTGAGGLYVVMTRRE